jgi:serine/threonine protein kinase
VFHLGKSGDSYFYAMEFVDGESLDKVIRRSGRLDPSTDIRSDLYSLGITLWEMLAGEVPFKGSTSRLIYQHQHATPPVDKLTHVPQPVIALLAILLEKDPERRLQTPTELLQVIPKVTEALESGRCVTTDQLRLGVDGIAAESKQSTRRFRR